jgi:hypothetical protein
VRSLSIRRSAALASKPMNSLANYGLYAAIPGSFPVRKSMVTPAKRVGRQLDTMLTAEQLQQHLDPVARRYFQNIFLTITNGWHAARWSIGVAGLIMDGERPALLRDELIDDIRAREIRGAIELPRRPLRCGDPVRITCGPLRGLEGLFAGMSGHERVAVLLAAPGRVTLPRDDVEAL